MQPVVHLKRFAWLACLAMAVASITLAGCSATAGRNKEAVARSDTGNFTLNPNSCSAPDEVAESYDYDPWESFNEKTFWFNYNILDHYLIKPTATVWHDVIPQPARQGLSNAMYNLNVLDRLVNNLLQGRFRGAGLVATEFLINTTVGVGGLIDASTWIGLRRSDADTGQTLGTYGFGPGPYLVLPFMLPLTVRDGIGYGIDGFLNPLYYFVPLIPNVALSATNTINDRAANLKVFQAAEETSIDLYAAVRNGYLQRRARSISRAIDERECEKEAGSLSSWNLENFDKCIGYTRCSEKTLYSPGISIETMPQADVNP